jgi:FkbM family methyltransferase
MNIKYLGTEYGGWAVDLDSIKDGDFIIDAGLGEDVSFLDELLKVKKINIIGIDPTEKSHKFLEKKDLKNFKLIKKCIAKHGIENIEIYKNKNPEHVSESYFSDHSSTENTERYVAECISFKTLIQKYNPALIKMDIEGAEYDVLKECHGVNQICVEFHHHCIPSKSKEDTLRCLDYFTSSGYRIISEKLEREFTLIKT